MFIQVLLFKIYNNVCLSNQKFYLFTYWLAYLLHMQYCQHEGVVLYASDCWIFVHRARRKENFSQN